MKRFISTLTALSLITTSALGQTLNDTFESSAQLTDQEVLDSQNYFHKGKAARDIEEACKAAMGSKYDPEIGCKDESSRPGQVFGGATGGMIEEMLPKLYATMGMMGGKLKYKEGSNFAKNNEGKKEGDDWCSKIPMAGEIVATATQMMGQNQIKQSVDANAKTGADQQKESLYAVARTHDQRAKTATIQGGVYAGTAACYGYAMAQGSVTKSTILRLAAAGTMSAIFFIKASKHKNYADNVRKAAKSLPGAGDCNPFTATQCFCAEPTSQASDLTNYNKVCVPKELARNDKNKTGIACATLEAGAKTAKADPTCKCKKTNSCFNHQIAQLGSSFGFGGIENSDPLRMLNMLNGDMDTANVEKFGNQLNAASRKLAAANVGEFPPANLKGRNKDIADGLKKLGMPAGMAAIAASQNAGGAGAAASAPGLSGIDDDLAAIGANSLPKKATYNYADAPGSSGSKRNGKNDSPTVSGKTGPSAINIDSFASEALAAAEINKDTSVGIFDVISNRYQRSAWTRFEMDKLVEEKSPDVIDPTVAPAPAQ